MSAAAGLKRGPVWDALLSAALFGAAAPLSKLLVERLPALQLAGLLYLGAALAVAPLVWRRRAAPRPSLDRANRWRLVGTIAAGGVVAPVLMVLALQISSAASVALLLTLEVAFTAALGALVFRDPLGPLGWLGTVGIMAAAAVVAWGGGTPGLLAALLVGVACLGWALDNHLTALIDALSPARTTVVKGVVAGGINLALASWLTPDMPAAVDVAAALAIGGLCYGVSLVLFIQAAQRLGATRAQATFATAPFWGVALAPLLFGVGLSLNATVALGLAGASVFLVQRDQHAHAHRHEAVEHDHWHAHEDGHHDHPHAEAAPDQGHSHPHAHEPGEHAHRHVPDLHHRHRH